MGLSSHIGNHVEFFVFSKVVLKLLSFFVTEI